ncbi:hypothetical protein S7711_05715 [Stachybotrys chartarum IBT 7711]|uniref:Methyltransferase domain-containing protein n=1 Tax=Stachybotrys chartarum (strain CBS 109288 / IBT 7711) TaxID=1280523 RepID=A0A084AVS2_STACB|nr:hypothetical protein S7711_05715 [Stachybotrys chartarum IBT 7711]KFA46553.1 hypothetical protein S40293_08431 [Stachybotrys chartarum IBT 40293]
MARKRRLKQRQAVGEASALLKAVAMYSDEPSALHSSRHSSDGTLSEHATVSDGTHTTITSIISTDEELPDDEDEAGVGEGEVDIRVVDEDDNNGDAVSLYPASHHPRISGPHRTEIPYAPDTLGVHMMTSDIAASTRSLWEQDLDYRELHGRRYCKDYFMPNDDLEQLRLALQHQVFLHVLDGELTIVPLEDPTHLLDVGTGTGEWAIRLAELFPQCEVVGTDIAAIAETSSVPMNVFFEIEDAEDWDRLPDYYDLIHFRSMEGAFQDWPFIYDNVFYSLKPGGWVEVQDFDTTEGLNRFRAQLPPDSPLHNLMTDLDLAAAKAGRQRGIAHMDPRVLMESGFVDVRVTEYVVPISVAEKSAGKIWLISCLDSLESNCLRLLTQYMDWEPEECKTACEAAAREMANIAKHPELSKGLIVKVRIVVARKPLDAPQAALPPYMRGSRSCSATPPELGIPGSPSPLEAGKV